jgi:Putative beta-barrel porin 2
MMTVGVSLWMAGVAHAQATPEPPPDAPFMVGPLTLAPVINTGLGHDNNIFNMQEADNPQSDVVANFSPTIDAWIRLARLRASGHARADFSYYKDFTDLRAVDWRAEGRLDLPLNVLTPFVSWTYIRTTNSQNLEIDAIAKQVSGSLNFGTSIRLTERVSVEVSGQRARNDFSPEAFYDDVDLSEQLDYTSTGGFLSLRYVLTPLTTVGVRGGLSQDRFDISTERDSNNGVVATFIEIQPLALISGGAMVGVQSRETLSGDAAEDFTGTVVQASLAYTLLQQTRFVFSASRSLQYSYIEGRTDYVEGILSLAVTHQLNEAWDVVGDVGRSRISYRELAPPEGSDTPVTFPDETYFSWAVGAGYSLRGMRVGFRADFMSRDAESSGLGGYDRTRVYSTVTYTF